MPSNLQPGDKIMYEGNPYTITAVTSWRDPVHGRVYSLELEAEVGRAGSR